MCACLGSAMGKASSRTGQRVSEHRYLAAFRWRMALLGHENARGRPRLPEKTHDGVLFEMGKAFRAGRSHPGRG